MWLKLGDSEIINLHYVSTIKRNSKNPSIEIIYHDLNNVKSIQFGDIEERDKAFTTIIENLSKLKQIFE
ncbi:MAG: hypothetical protein H7A23_09915 [Leptospiraceae bacterium]|nr:hypothetical protein [Leptospiraceae bacterium]MCP5494860.1 hypothetical protein [Leptospiraceae bacterium]